jgi:hypothetical protein
MSNPIDGEERECPGIQGGVRCNGKVIFGTYTLTYGDDIAFVDDVTERGPINKKSERKPAWHCNACGHYFLERAEQ